MMQQMQQRMVENYREQLGVTNNAEWAIIQQRLTKVISLRTGNVLNNGLGGLLGGMRGGGGGNGRGLGAMLGQQSDPNTENLQNSIDRNATSAQIKAALTKLREARKQKQAELDKAQEDLRGVLTSRQEAILVLAGMLD
jgi:hypothetical protein